MFYDVLSYFSLMFIEKRLAERFDLWSHLSRSVLLLVLYFWSRWYNGQIWRIWRPDLGFWMFGMHSSFTIYFGTWRSTCLTSIDNTYFKLTWQHCNLLLRTLLFFRVSDPTKKADIDNIDKWKGMCDPTTDMEKPKNHPRWNSFWTYLGFSLQRL